MIKSLGLSCLVALAPVAAAAHKLNVFASTDCEMVIVEAKFTNGKPAQKGEVKFFDGENALMATDQLASDGTARISLEDADTSGGVLIEVDTGGHNNYWILTPEDIARKCGS